LKRKLQVDFELNRALRTWNRHSQIKAVCRREAAAERPGMASLACLDLAMPVSCPHINARFKS